MTVAVEVIDAEVVGSDWRAVFPNGSSADLVPITETIPASVESMRSEMDGLGALVTASEWKRAAIVWAFTTDEVTGRGKRGTSTALSGFHPQFNRFLLAPSHDCKLRREVIGYAIDHASTAAKTIRFQIMGADISGSVTSASAESARLKLADGAQSIKDAGTALEWAA